MCLIETSNSKTLHIQIAILPIPKLMRVVSQILIFAKVISAMRYPLFHVLDSLVGIFKFEGQLLAQEIIHNDWGEPERAPHRRDIHARIVYIYIYIYMYVCMVRPSPAAPLIHNTLCAFQNIPRNTDRML